MLVFTPLILLTVWGIRKEKLAGKISYFFLRCWGGVFCTLCLIFYKIEGTKLLDTEQAYIYTCNHNSFLDGIAICLAIPTDFRPLGKIEMLKIPVFGLMYRHVVIMVDRKSDRSKQKSMIQMLEKLKQGISVLIFPEGTMNKTSELLQKFHNGAFALAIESGVQVVPVVIQNSGRCMPREPKFTLQPGIIKINFSEPVKPLPGMPVQMLKDRVFDIMEEKLKSSKV